MSPTELTKVRDVLARALSVEAVNQLGRDTGQAVRLRTVTPHRLFLAVVSALASGHVASLADLLRAFNYHNGVHVAYKAFYNRLARVGFTLFMRGMCARLIERLRLQTLTPAGHTAVARFTDIVIHDGSSFAVKPTLRGTFPGRFTTLGPAAVEVHATYSGCADEIRAVQIAPDREAERPFLPDPATLTGCLLLADRGYPSVPYFEAVQAHGGAFLVRLTRNYDPWVRTAWVDGRRSTVPPGIRLSRFLATRATRTVDLDVEFDRGDHRVGFRVVAVPGRDPTMTRLCTNLPRTPFSPALVARLYRFRWQRVVLQGVEILREPPQVRYRESTHRRRTDLGESLRGDPQALPGACRAVRRSRRRRVDAARGHVRVAYPGGAGPGAPAGRRPAGRPATRTCLPARERSTGQRASRTPNRPPTGWTRTRGARLSDHL